MPQSGKGVEALPREVPKFPYKAFISYSHAADGKLAPQLQSSLHRFAKPWYRLRAMRAFRDETSLSNTPELWPSIETALSESEFFLLLASPTAAESQWVKKEIAYWVASRSKDKLLIILTDGNLKWDQGSKTFDWTETTALPADMEYPFEDEPRYTDFRAIKSAGQLSARNPMFRAAVADVASTLLGRSKDELIGEDVRLHRQTVRIAWLASMLLAVLAVTASIMAYVANVQRNSARSREIAATAVAHLDIDPEQSLRRAMAAVEVADTPEAISALREALVRSSVRRVIRPGLPIVSGSFSPSGASVLLEVESGEKERSLYVWDSLTGERRCGIEGARGGHFTPDGALIRTSGGRLYDAKSCQPRAGGAGTEQTPDEEGDRSDEAFIHYLNYTEAVYRDPAGVLELGYQNEVPVVRETGTGRILRVIRTYLDPIGGAAFSEGDGWSRVVTWPMKHVYMESGGGPTEIGEKVARVWGAEFSDSDRVLAGHRRAINAAVFGPDAEVVVTGSDDRTARVWISRTGEEFAVLRGHVGPVSSVAVSADGGRVLTVSKDGTARIWEPATIRPSDAHVVDLFSLRYGMPFPELEGEQPVGLPQLSGDGRSVLAHVDGSGVVIWDATTGQRRGAVTEESWPLKGGLSPDGARVVTVTGDPSVSAGDDLARVWDVATGKVIQELRGHSGPVYGASYSPDGKWIVTVGDDGFARLWNASTFELIHELHESDTRVLHAAFRSDSAQLVTSSRDSLARIWDVASGRLVAEMFGHEGGVLHATFSPDDSLIVSVGEDGIRIWDAATGKMLGRYMGGSEPTTTFLTPDCSELVAGDYEISGVAVRVHAFGACGALDQLITVARARVIPSPTVR